MASKSPGPINPNRCPGNFRAPATGPAIAPVHAGHSFRGSILRLACRLRLRARIPERPEAMFARAWGNADREGSRIAPWHVPSRPSRAGREDRAQPPGLYGPVLLNI